MPGLLYHSWMSGSRQVFNSTALTNLAKASAWLNGCNRNHGPNGKFMGVSHITSQFFACFFLQYNLQPIYKLRNQRSQPDWWMISIIWFLELLLMYIVYQSSTTISLGYNNQSIIPSFGCWIHFNQKNHGDPPMSHFPEGKQARHLKTHHVKHRGFSSCKAPFLMVTLPCLICLMTPEYHWIPWYPITIWLFNGRPWKITIFKFGISSVNHL